MDTFKDKAPTLTHSQWQMTHHALKCLRTHRSVLLASETGTGKTYIACTIAKKLFACGIAPIIVAPAHLISMWKRVCTKFNLHPIYISFQQISLNRFTLPQNQPLLWIIDEAHFLKSHTTQRYHQILKLTACHLICLLTATPISMSKNDLYNLAKICGYPSESAFQNFSILQQYIFNILVENKDSLYSREFSVSHKTYPVSIVNKEYTNLLYKLLTAILDINVYITDKDDRLHASPILSQILLHRLLSHRHACLLTLRRMHAYYRASHLKGTTRFLTRKECLLWLGKSQTQGLLPFVEPYFGREIEIKNFEILDSTIQKLDYASQLCDALCKTEDANLKEIECMLSSIPNNQRIVLFTQYADTAIYYAENLKTSRTCALVTTQCSRYGKTPCARELIEPVFDASCEIPDFYTQANLPPPTLLICSDIFSSGHNLHRANVLIHIDLPWNPATLRQREGRLCRLGQKARRITILSPRYTNTSEPMTLYTQHLYQRIKSRDKLMTTWKTQTFEPPPFRAIFHLDSNVIPSHWALIENQWIPISPITPKNCAACQPLTLERAFLPTMTHLKKSLSPFWMQLKKHYAFLDSSSDLWFDLLWLIAIFPRILRGFSPEIEPQNDKSFEQAFIHEIMPSASTALPQLRLVFQIPPLQSIGTLYTLLPN